MVKTNCVCSGAHCAAVGGFAALRMRRPLYGERAPCMLAIFAARILRREAFKFVIARRPQADVAISQYPAGSWGSCRRKRNCLPEIATGAKRPRNDKPLAFTILTIACLLCRCAAGSGMPLPYNARLETFHFPFSIFRLRHAPKTTAKSKIGDAGKSGIPDRLFYISNGSMERTGWPTSVR